MDLDTLFTEVDDGQEFEFNQDAQSAKRSVVCPWSSAVQAAAQLMGFSVKLGKTTLRIGAERHPLAPWMQVAKVGIKGVGRLSTGSWSSGIQYEQAQLTIEYDVPKYDDEEDDEDDNPEDKNYLTQQVDASCDIITAPMAVTETYTRKSYPYGSVTSTRQIIKHIRVPTVSYKLTQHSVTSPSWTDYHDKIGKVNSVAMLNGAVETVLFDAMSARREVTSRGNRAWQIDLTFIYHPHGWNNVLHPESLTWVAAESVEKSGSKPYQSANLSTLI